MNRILLFIVIAIPSLFTLMSHSGGRAAAQNQGNTGAPGETTTCANGYCHGNTTIQVDVVLELQTLDGNMVSDGMINPGTTYKVKTTINHLGGDTPVGYGYQLLALDMDGNSINTFSNPGTNGQIATVNSSGRQYAEHDGVSPSNEFTVEWTVPSDISGTVTFYAAGNGVNDNGASSGDGANSTSIEYMVSTVSTTNPTAEKWGLKIAPNPVGNTLSIRLDTENLGAFQVSILDVLGRETLSWTQDNMEDIPVVDVSSLPKGYYTLLVRKGKESAVSKFVKK